MNVHGPGFLTPPIDYTMGIMHNRECEFNSSSNADILLHLIQRGMQLNWEQNI